MYPYEKAEKGIMKRYRIVGGHCKACSLRSTCLPDSHKNRSRFVYRSIHQSDIDRVRRRQTTKYFKAKLTERAWKIEGLFGEAKDNHCLRRIRYRGLVNAQIQFYLTALTQNLKRVAGWGVLLKFTLRSDQVSLKAPRGAIWRLLEETLENIESIHRPSKTGWIVSFEG